MKETPTIAVVMCTYNGERFLREQMDSILAQTYPIAEIIVQDDGSTDNTVNILREYAERVPQMQVYVNEKNLGFNRNFHTACLRATADYIAISDQDDVWMPNKLERQIEAIGPCNICYSTHLRGRDMATAHTVAPRCNLEAMLFTGIAGHTMIARRDFIQRPESWTNDRIVYDWSLALNAYFFRQPNAIVRVDEPLNWHRSHDGEAALLQNIAVCGEQKRTTWQPYVYGLRNYRALQRKPNWHLVYNLIATHTADNDALALPHRMASLMLRPGLWPLMQLCWLCMKHRNNLYPKAQSVRGVMGAVRGFFYPFIFSWHCSQFDM